MRIGIDARTALSPKTGDRTYALNLIRRLARLDAENEYFLLVHEPVPPGLLPTAPNFQTCVLPSRWSRWWTLVSLPRFAAQQHLDLVHLQYLTPFACSAKVITTVHDITFARHPETFPLKDRLLLSAFVPRAVRRAARTLTGSESTKRDIVQRYHVIPERVVVTPYGVDDLYRRVEDGQVAALLERLHISPPYALYVGVLQPRKNLVRLVEAFARIQREVPHQLVIAGRRGWGDEPLLAKVQELGLRGRALFTGYVADEDLPALYAGADVFVYPSLYEGFGLPPLEAMACGTPVITSNLSAMPEVVGDAGLLVDPLSVAAIADALRRVLTDAGLRQDLSRRGVERARQFTWERTARGTMAVYREVNRERQGATGG